MTMSTDNIAMRRQNIMAIEKQLANEKTQLALEERNVALDTEIAAKEQTRAWFQDEIHRAEITLKTAQKFDGKDLLLLAENAWARLEAEHLCGISAGQAASRNFKVDFVRSRGLIAADNTGEKWREIPGGPVMPLFFAFDRETTKGLDAARGKFLPGVVEAAKISRQQRQPAAVA